MSYKRKIFKYTIISLSGLLILTSIAVIILINVVNPNDYKSLIIDAVNNNTGRKLKLEGNISWQIWPNIGFLIKQVSLSNPLGFDGPDFIDIQSANLSLDLLPLFSKIIIVNDLNIEGLKLNLSEIGNKNNWTFTQNEVPGKPTNTNVRFELHSFSITHSYIHYSNLNNKTTKEINNLNFSLDTPYDGGIRFNSQAQRLNLDNVNFNLNDHLKGILQLELSDHPKLNYKGNLTLAPFSINKTFEQLNLPPINIRNKTVLNNVNLKVNFNGNDKTVLLSNINLNLGATNLSGIISINDFLALNIQNDLNINKIELSDWINTNGYKLPMHNIKLHGVLSNSSQAINKIGVDEHLSVGNIILYGINADRHIKIAEKSLTIGQLINPLDLYQNLDRMLSSSTYARDLKQKTNLGHLDTRILLRNGKLTTPGFILSGPTLRTTSSGLVNFNSKYIDYKLYTKIISVPAKTLLGSLNFTYLIIGNLNNPDTKLDKSSLRKQVFDYSRVIEQTSSAVGRVKKSTTNFWNKIFH
jgi:hypothetical protein